MGTRDDWARLYADQAANGAAMTEPSLSEVLRTCREHNSFEPLAALALDVDTRDWLLAIPPKPRAQYVHIQARLAFLIFTEKGWSKPESSDAIARRFYDAKTGHDRRAYAIVTGNGGSKVKEASDKLFAELKRDRSRYAAKLAELGLA